MVTQKETKVMGTAEEWTPAAAISVLPAVICITALEPGLLLPLGSLGCCSF